MEMQIRTDLAMEAQVLQQADGHLPKGVTVRRENLHGVPATVVEIRSVSAAKAVGKPRGTYITVELGSVLRREKESFEAAVRTIGSYLDALLALPASLPVLVAGLGNRDITPDAVGPMTADHILVTRHMLREMPSAFRHFRPVGAVVPGVLGTTGMESAETVRALAEKTEAAAVVAVDAIAARDTSLLCSTVQLSNAGIAPGSGIGNRRHALDKSTLGVPVIALGVPTVTDAATLASDLLTRAGSEASEDRLRQVSGGMIVTSSDIDRRVREVSRVLAYGINSALHPDLTVEDLTDLTF